MTRLMLTTLPLVLLLACDLQEDPVEEAAETVDAVRDGDSLDEVADEAADVFQSRGELEKRLDKVGDWLADRAEEIDGGQRDADDATRKAFEDLETRWAKTKKDLEAAGDDVAEEIVPRVDALEKDVGELFDSDGEEQ